MDLDATAELEVAQAPVVEALADLASYPHWLSIVGAAAPAAPHPDDVGPAWAVELIGRIGPFTKTKRVRMVRAAHDPDAGTVRFERVEHDGRAHNVWVLTGEATPAPGGRTKVHVHLHYGGGRTLPGADLLLRQEAGRAGSRLARYLASLE